MKNQDDQRIISNRFFVNFVMAFSGVVLFLMASIV